MPSGPKSSPDLPGPRHRNDKQRERQEAAAKDADKSDVADRDLVHGEGGSVGLPTKPDDIDHDD